MPLTEFEIQHGGRRLPVLDPAAIRATVLDNPAYWYEDVNFTAIQQYTNRRIFEEGVDAGYVQAQAKISRLTLLGGVRKEWVSTETFTFFRARTTAIATEPDHFKRAALDFAKQSRDGTYSKTLPSIHASFDITSKLKLRASWSTSYGRPLLANVVAGVTADDVNRRLTVGNPDLKPQSAKNIDVKLEYYYSDSGSFTVTGYQKKITDYISSQVRSGIFVGSGSDNGYDGLYPNYELVQAANTGSALLKGFEADFRQRLNFLPGAFKGLTVRGNYTYLETSGKFAGTVDLKPGQIPGFVPRAANAGLQYNYKKFGASYDVNFTGKYPVGYSLTSPGNGNIYRDSLVTMNTGVTYRVRPNMTLFLNMNNIDQQGPQQYTYDESRTRFRLISPRTLKFGVTGQF